MRNLSATEYLQFVRSGASEGIKNKTLSKDSVRGYIRHLPIKGCPEFDAWGEMEKWQIRQEGESF